MRIKIHSILRVASFSAIVGIFVSFGTVCLGASNVRTPFYESTVIPNCNAIVYGRDVVGEQTLTLADTIVSIDGWQLYPSLPPVINATASTEATKQHELECCALSMQWELQQLNMPILEIKQRIIQLYRDSKLVESIELLDGERHSLLWSGENQPTILYICDQLKEDPTVPYPGKSLEERRKMARSRYERWKYLLTQGCLVLFAHESDQYFSSLDIEHARSEILAVRSKAFGSITELSWGHDHMLSYSSAVQLAVPHSIERKIKCLGHHHEN